MESIMNKKNQQDKIAFLFPGRDNAPIGGYKIAYEYANRFSSAGYEVKLIYPFCEDIFSKPSNNIFFRLKRYFGFILKWKIPGRLKAGEWFNLSSKVKKVFVFKLNNFFLRKQLKGFKIVATAIETAYALNKITFVSNKDKVYFIQDFEKWNGKTDDDVYNSYKFPLTKIVIAPWLLKEVEKAGETATLIPNGFDFEYFKLTNPIKERKPYEIAMLYHKDDRKRCIDSINALKIVKEKIPELHVTMFGTPEKPDLPEWFSYYRCPDKENHNKVYNNASIFVAASSLEGFGLTVGEAMICGACAVCTDTSGFKMMIEDEKTGLLSPIFAVEKLAQNIIRLIEDNDLRIKLAENGNTFIKQFTWENAFALFKSVIEL